MGYLGRDVDINVLDTGHVLVTACDSCGGIGEKANDQVKVPAALVGRLTARVSLLEVVCAGAVPRVMTVAVCSEPEPTASGILKGIRREITDAGLQDLSLVISTEKNVATCQTGLGIGVTGTCNKQDLRIGRSRVLDQVFCLGRPRVGPEVAQALDHEIFSVHQARTLLKSPHVNDIVPVGSRGILAEAESLASQANARFIPSRACPLDLAKSAGPATCAIFTCSPGSVFARPKDDLPLFFVGTLKPMPEPMPEPMQEPMLKPVA